MQAWQSAAADDELQDKSQRGPMQTWQLVSQPLGHPAAASARLCSLREWPASEGDAQCFVLACGSFIVFADPAQKLQRMVPLNKETCRPVHLKAMLNGAVNAGSGGGKCKSTKAISSSHEQCANFVSIRVMHLFLTNITSTAALFREQGKSPDVYKH